MTRQVRLKRVIGLFESLDQLLLLLVDQGLIVGLLEERCTYGDAVVGQLAFPENPQELLLFGVPLFGFVVSLIRGDHVAELSDSCRCLGPEVGIGRVRVDGGQGRFVGDGCHQLLCGQLG